MSATDFLSPAPIDPFLTTLFGLLCFLVGAAVAAIWLQRRQPRRRPGLQQPPTSPVFDRAYLAGRARAFAHAQGRPEMADVLTQFLVHTARRAERLRRRWATQPTMQLSRRWGRQPWWR